MKLQRLLVTMWLLAVAPLAVIILDNAQSHASLLGSPVEGVFTFTTPSFPGLNFYDPTLGRVPAGFGNSSIPNGGSGDNVVNIGDPLVEFGYEGAVGVSGLRATADFTASGFVTFTLAPTNGAVPANITYMHVYSSPGFAPFTALTPVSGTVTNNVCSFFSNAIQGTVSCNTTTTATPLTAPFVAVYQFTPQVPVPEPGSLTLLGLGLVGVVARYRKRT